MLKIWKALLCCALVAGAISSTSPAGADADSAEQAARQLVRSIPEDQRYQCLIADPTSASDVGTQIASAAASVSSVVECSPSGAADYVAYAQMTSAQAMNALYLQFAQGSGGPTQSEEGKCPSEGTWQLDDADVGRVACYYSTMNDGTVIPETVSRVWTDDQNNIIGFASAADGNSDAVALRKWWTDTAGPLKEPEDVVGFAPSSDTAVERARSDLTSRVPKSLRSGCKPSTRSAERDRLWVRAELICQPDSSTGVNQVLYDSVDPRIIDKYFASSVPAASTLDGSCPDTGTFTVGKGKSKHTVGQYACTKTAPAPDGSTILYTWSDRKRGIVTYAFGTDADQVIKYVASGAADPGDPSAKTKRGS